MSVIYQPSGKAREYSPLACNLYMGCTHMCKYCYAPHVIGKSPADYFAPPRPRDGILQKLQAQLEENPPRQQVMLSFVGDVYCQPFDGGKTTTAALELLLKHGVPVAILTKGGMRALRDVEVFQRFGQRIAIGATLTFWDEATSQQWESGAATPTQRLEALKALKYAGLATFASFEPVIDPAQSLEVLKRSLEADCVDIYKVGKIDKGYEDTDWESFLGQVVQLVRGAGKRLYIKQGLRKAAPGIALLPEETQPDLYSLKV